MQQNLFIDQNMVTEVELSYKNKMKASQRPVGNCSTDFARILRANWPPTTIELREEFRVLYLNRANRVLAMNHASTGGITYCIVDARLIFSTALKLMATSIVLAHNHPSGSLRPSRADEEITQKMINGGKLLDITVLDHIIITDEAHFSFADEGLL